MRYNRTIYTAFAGVIIVVGIVLGIVLPGEDEIKPESVVANLDEGQIIQDKSSVNNSDSSTGQSQINLPTFDVVRVNPKGDAVIAGRATPGSKIMVMDGDNLVGSVFADSRGEWVLLPDIALLPGDRQLTLIEELTNGVTLESADTVVLSIPDRAVEEGQTPLVVLSPREGGEGSRILQTPSSGKTDFQHSEEIIDQVNLDSVDYDASGEIIISGRATPESFLNVYVDDQFIGSVRTDKEGNWELIPGERLKPGDHRIRVDRVDDVGEVLARIETPLTRVSVDELLLGDAQVVVQPGNSLWRIARRAYGGGIKYTIIFEANRSRIRDPNLIYPGQIFSIPLDG